MMDMAPPESLPMHEAHPLALVTGASSGIGTEIALELARRGFDLILSGRDAERLTAVADQVLATGGAAEIQIVDLEAPGGIEALVTQVGSRELEILVNNAGFGLSGPLERESPERLAAMVHLNVTALTLLTRAFLPAMVARGHGRILNVASTGAFQPCPGMAAYGATKAYVLSFSEAVAEELAGTGVFVTALCPGPTRTRFAERAAMVGSFLFRDAMAADAVARSGVQALLAGRRLRVTGWRNRLMAFAIRFSPRGMTARLAKAMMLKRN
ncbi:MAG: family oxidoreductase [Holophagaceae bacterium]|nr:family oxidoreductase [Holophagaceae bacterium]